MQTHMHEPTPEVVSGSGGGGGALPEYRDISAMNSATDYVVAELTSTTAEGSAEFTLRALEPTIKHTLTFLATLHESNAVQFTVLQNVYESDTPRFTALKLVTTGGISFICVRCGAAIVKGEMRVYDNQDSSGSLASYGTPFVIPATLTVATGILQQEHALVQKGLTNSAVVQSDSKLSAPLAEANTVATTTVASYGGTEVNVVNDLNMTNHQVKQASVVDTVQLTNSSGSVTLGSSLNTDVHALTTTQPSGISVTANLNFGGTGGITQCAAINIDNAAVPGQCQVTNGAFQMNGNDILNAGTGTFTTAILGGVAASSGGLVSLGNLHNFSDMPAPTAASHAANKQYVDAAVSGGVGSITFPVDNPMTSNLDGGAFGLLNMSTVTTTTLAANTLTTSTPASTFIACSAKQLSDVADPTLAQDAATKNYVDANVGFSNPATTSLDMAGNEINLNLGTLTGGYIVASPWTYSTVTVCSVTSGTAAQPVFFTGAPTGTGPAAFSPLIQGAASILLPIDGVYSIHMWGQWNGSIQGSDGGEQACFFMTDPAGFRIMAWPSAQHYQSGTEWLHSFMFCGHLPAGDYRLYGNHYNGSKNYDGNLRVTHII